MSAPLADKIRPKSLDEMFGQKHLLSENGILRRIAAGNKLPNMIFYGPPGTGKTTVARILAENAGKRLHKLNGTTASTSDIKAVIEELGTFQGMNGVLLYLDEIQYLNKKQQQTLLEFLETGQITLIASTTENPYFYVYNAILSRSTVFEFKPVEHSELLRAVNRALQLLSQEDGISFKAEDGVTELVAYACGGDVRKSINIAELLWLSAPVQDGCKTLLLSDAEQITGRSALVFDKDGDQHYNLLSALQKSVRGSDENAALHYLARLLEGGDLISPCRRLLVMASEDIGLAYPQCVSIVKSCIDSALQLGLPEARIPLAQAVVLMCTAPKSNSAYLAMDAAMADVRMGNFSEIPEFLQDGHYAGAKKLGKSIGYKYPHDYPNHYVEQQYLPDKLKGKVYYHFGDNKNEQAAKQYREKITVRTPKDEKND
ncbi:MAG: replication-associated recombination protein A [Oscillospiraceae bacterium]|nr:replication-associated recombination protein A [Oscillospiraceae bacterium]